LLVSELLRVIPGARLAGGRDTADFGAAVYDSRLARPGAAFFALPGLRHDGHDFIPQAVASGAKVIVGEHQRESGIGSALGGVPDVTLVTVPNARHALGLISAALYGSPTSRLYVAGVTGTKGKTTTTHLVRAIFEEDGRRTGLVGTVHNVVGGRSLPVKYTTPEAPELQELFRRMVDAGDTHTVMEVSSHALALERVAGTAYKVAALTNIGHDHLDFHHTTDEYIGAKALLFGMLADDPASAAVVNADDPAGRRMLAATPGNARRLTYGLSPESQVRAQDIRLGAAGCSYLAVTPAGAAQLKLQLPGRFNVYNSLCALAVGLAAGVPLMTCLCALSKVPGVPGRFERVVQGQPFAVIVDYAHTPESLAGVLETAREITTGRLIAVFGCGGDRDRTRRPTMGRLAMELADRVYVTSDNPRTEDPQLIVDEVAAGISSELTGGAGGKSWVRQVDRAAAIHAAITEAGEGDVVLIAGKGHETYQIIGDRTIHFDDREVAADALARRGYGTKP